MGSTKGCDKKTEIMQFAERELAAKGVHGFSFRDVAAACQIKSSSVHYHFPKKNHLIVAVLEEFVGRFESQFAQWEAQESDPRRRLECFMQTMRCRARGRDNSFCPATMAAAELGGSDPEVTRITRKLFDGAVGWLAKQLAALRGLAEPGERERNDAQVMYQMIGGGIMSVRMTGEPERLETVMQRIEAEILSSNFAREESTQP